MATQQEVAEHLDLSDRQVRNLLSDGILPAPKGRGGYIIDDCRKAYIGYLRTLSKRHYSPEADPEEINYDLERARLVKAQANAQELKNEIALGTVAPIELIAWVLSTVAGEAAGLIDSIPLNIRRKFPELSNRTLEEIKRICVKAQNSIARVDEVLEVKLEEYLTSQKAD